MKKYLFLGIAATAMLASCTNDEIVETTTQNAIAFDNAFVNNSTRSVDPSTKIDDLGSFKVWGTVDDGADAVGATLIFNKLTVSSDDDGETWDYEDDYIQYWQAGYYYDFVALANAEDPATVDANGMPATVSYTLTDTDQKDLLHAYKENMEGKASGNADVAFTFNHQLSKVKFAFVNKFPINSKTEIQVSDIKITNADKTNTLTLNTQGNEWGTAGAEEVELTFGSVIADHAADVTPTNTAASITSGETLYSYNEKLIIPTEEKKFNIEFTVKVIQGGAITTFNHTGTNAIQATLKFQKGYSYVLKAEIDGSNANPEGAMEPIEFTASVAEWTPNTDDQNNIYTGEY